jgi:hypothetical protein
VRVGWQPQGQPAWQITDDVVVLNAVEDDDVYNRVRDVQTLPNDTVSLIQLTTYTRVWRAMFTLYGPNSFDRARILKSALYQQTSHDTLASANLYLVTDVIAPQRVPELYEKQWWERVDFSFQLNEAVYEAPTVPSVASVEIIVEDAASSIAGVPLADFTVTGE